MTEYNKVTPAFIDKLRDIVGAEFVFTDAETLDKYKTDEETDERCFHLPDVVIAPANAEEIAAVMKLCNECLIPLPCAVAAAASWMGPSLIRAGSLSSWNA